MSLVKLLLVCMLVALGSGEACAGVIQYIATGRPSPEVKVSYSRNNGAKWEATVVKPGQVFNVPKDATHLTINGAPRDPRQNYKVKEGNIF